MSNVTVINSIDEMKLTNPVIGEVYYLNQKKKEGNFNTKILLPSMVIDDATIIPK